MAEDEFFKRIAETLVVDEPVSERPSGTAERRAAQVKQRVVADEASGVEPEPSREPARRNGVDPAEQERGTGGDSVETTDVERRWGGARPPTLVISLMGVVAVAVGVILALGGQVAAPSRREVPPVMESVPSPPVREPRIEKPKRRGRPKTRERRAVRTPRSSAEPESDGHSEDAPVAAGQVSSGGSNGPTGTATREGFGFEDGSP
jgi:hypothetical protein